MITCVNLRLCWDCHPWKLNPCRTLLAIAHRTLQSLTICLTWGRMLNQFGLGKCYVYEQSNLDKVYSNWYNYGIIKFICSRMVCQNCPVIRACNVVVPRVASRFKICWTCWTAKRIWAAGFWMFLSEGHALIEFVLAIVFDVDASDASTQVIFLWAMSLIVSWARAGEDKMETLTGSIGT